MARKPLIINVVQIETAEVGLDRLVHNAHRIDLAGESLRRKRSKSIAKD
jgi:hypothetical protein